MQIGGTPVRCENSHLNVCVASGGHAVVGLFCCCVNRSRRCTAGVASLSGRGGESLSHYVSSPTVRGSGISLGFQTVVDCVAWDSGQSRVGLSRPRQGSVSHPLPIQNTHFLIYLSYTTASYGRSSFDDNFRQPKYR